MASKNAPQPRAAHLLDDVTSRDLYGTVRGACKGCSDCGRYIIKTKENYTSKHQSAKGTQRHPDNDPSITYCSRCGCPPDAHEIVVWENERELGTDAFALHQWDSAIVHYTRAIDLKPVDASLWSNRAATYLAKGWHAQALHDAEHAASLRPEWFRPWARKGAALLGLHKPEEALKAYQQALKCAEKDDIVNEATISGIKTAIKDAEKKIQKTQKRRTTASASGLVHKPTARAPLAYKNEINDRRATVNPRTPAHTEEIRTEVSSTFAFEEERSHTSTTSPETNLLNNEIESSNDPGINPTTENIPSSSISSTQKQQEQQQQQRQLFAEVQAQYSNVVNEVEKLKALMDQLQEQMNLDDDTEELNSSEELIPPLRRQSSVSITTSSSKSFEGSDASTEDGAVNDIDAFTNSENENEVEYEEEKEKEDDEGSTLPSSPILRPRETSINWINENISVATDEEEGGEQENQKQQQEEEIVDSSNSEDEFDAEFEWLDTVHAARKQLGADETKEFGFIPPPPPSLSTLSSQRRKAKSSTIQDGTSTTADHQDIKNNDYNKSSSNDEESRGRSLPSKLDLGSLQSLFVAAAALQRRRDVLGIERYACKTCGPTTCPQYENNTILKQFHSQQQQQQQQNGTSRDAAQLVFEARQCSSCGCNCTAHETKEESAAREDGEQRAKERQERIIRQREERQRQRQRHHQPPPSPETERIKRVMAAAARKAAAEETGEPLQSTDCDVLTQSKRGTCTSCKACSGFIIYYSSTDANNPEIMLYCATCGCTAESHPIDSSWEQKEAARREAENAAAARAAARARQSFHAQAIASLDARKEEAEAYAVLGLHYGADSKAVTRAYKRMALKLHPDKVNVARRNSGEEDEKGDDTNKEATEAAAVREAHAAFVKVTQAYKLLSELKH